jgi:hypothetical protein
MIESEIVAATRPLVEAFAALDGDYLAHWAAELGLSGLLERARREAGTAERP